MEKMKNLKIRKVEDGRILSLFLEGRLDTTTAKDLELELNSSFIGKTDVFLDFKDLNYVSSAGLRVILAAQKQMNEQGNMIIKNVNDFIMETFEVTGFVDILTIEQHF